MPKHTGTGIIAILALLGSAAAQRSTSIPIKFMSEGSTLHGRFFPSGGVAPATLVLVPDWAGSPDDVLGLGALLSGRGINVLTFNPRGMYGSEGVATFANTLSDIGAAMRWVERPDVQQRFKVNLAKLALGGHSFGGGMAMAYAAKDPRVRRVVSIAGNDHGEFVREFQRNAAFAEASRQLLLSTLAPKGQVRFDMDAYFQELLEHQDVYGLRENAAKLADRSILLIGGWADDRVAVRQFLLPLYWALKRAGAPAITFLAYQDGHTFSAVREQLASDIRGWLLRDGRR